MRYIEIIRENKGLFEEDGEDGGFGTAMQSQTGRAIKKAAWAGATGVALKGIAKLVPVLGDAIAVGDAVVSASRAYKALREFTDLSIEVSGFKPSNTLGEWSLLEMYPEEMKKLAEGLKKNMTEDDRKQLLEHYNEFMVNFKDMVVEILIALKEASAGIGLGAAVAIKILPVETATKEFLFFMARLAKSMPDFVQEIRKFQDKFMIQNLVPVFGFFSDANRIYEFIEIDKLVTKPVKNTGGNESTAVARVSESHSRRTRKSRTRMIEII